MTDTVTQTLKWRPRAKQRPRTTTVNGRSVTYTPKETRDTERDLREQWTADAFEGPINVHLILADEYVTVDIQVCPPPMSKKLKGDVDNYAKTVLDALNNVAWIDDKQIVELKVVKL